MARDLSSREVRVTCSCGCPEFTLTERMTADRVLKIEGAPEGGHARSWRSWHELTDVDSGAILMFLPPPSSDLKLVPGLTTEYADQFSEEDAPERNRQARPMRVHGASLRYDLNRGGHKR